MWLERLYDEFTTPHRGPPPATLLGVVLVALGVLLFVVGTVFGAMTGQTSVLALLLGFFLLALGAISVLNLSRRRPSASHANASCPNCGAPPEGSVTANGFTKCLGCGHPYFAF